MTWTAEIFNDPDRDHDLYIELLENDEYRAKLFLDKDGELVLTFYGGDRVSIPFEWLRQIASKAKEDLATK